MNEPVRLLSPTQSRIFQPDLDRETPEEVQAAVAAAKVTARALINAGWRVYGGPGVADGRGWVIPGSDPALTPIDPFTVYGVRSSVGKLL